MALIIARVVSPNIPTIPKTFPTIIPIIAPIAYLDKSNTPPLLTTSANSLTLNWAPIQTNWTPRTAAVPALVKTAVVNDPICNISGKNVFIRADRNIGTIIIPAGTFFKNFKIIIISYCYINFT